MLKPFVGPGQDELPGFIPSIYDAQQVAAVMFNAVASQYSDLKCEAVTKVDSEGMAVLSGAVAVKAHRIGHGDQAGSFYAENHLLLGHAALGAVFASALLGDVRRRLFTAFEEALPQGALQEVKATSFKVVLPDGVLNLESMTASGRSYIATRMRANKKAFLLH